MSDLISRQAAIDAMESVSDGICEQQAVDALCELPSVDVVEVVRCKDCKFWDSGCKWCDLWGDTQEYGDGYCSYGERKDDEHK